MMTEQLVLFIAMACHEANRAWCESVGDYSQKHWAEAEEWQRDSAIKGVEFRIANPNAGESSQHDAWMADKIKEGWVYGEKKDAVAKTHPCIVPFHELPVFQQKKDKLFCAIVDALRPPLPAEEMSGNAIVGEQVAPTYGQLAVGYKFNPSGDDHVADCKRIFAKAIDQMHDLRSNTASNEQFVNCTDAIMHIKTAQMWAVKAITWRD